MKEWQKHLERAEEKLAAAGILSENKLFNDAVSEAYYSMFHAAKALLSIKDLHPKTHKGTISEFGLQFVAPGSIEEFYGKMLAVAEDEREKADYDVYYAASKEEAEALIEDATNFLERILKAIKRLE